MIQQSLHDAPEPNGTGPACFVVVCRGPNCRERGGLTLRTRLGALLRNEPAVRLVGYACFGQCDVGPNVMFYPEGVWYGGLSGVEAAERVVRHATVGEPMPAPPLSLPPTERREHLKNITQLIGMLERDRRRERRWWWPF